MRKGQYSAATGEWASPDGVDNRLNKSSTPGTVLGLGAHATFNRVSAEAGYFDETGKWKTGTKGGFFTTKGGEWCEGTVTGGYRTPNGQWVNGSLSDDTKIAGATWLQLKASAMSPNYQQQDWFDSIKNSPA